MRDVVTKYRRLSLAGRKPKISPAYEKLTALLRVYPMSPALLAWYSGSSPEGWRPVTSKIYQQSHTFCFALFFLPLTSNIKCTEYQNLNVSRLVLHVSLSNLLKPGITSRMKMLLEQLMFTCMHACVYFCVYVLICVDACMYMCTLMFMTRDSQVILFSPCVFVCVWLSMFVTMFVRTI